jgi:hypothetical protein
MPKLIAVLGMHRSGTSVIAGTLAQHGVDLGPASESNPFNPRGNREIPSLRRLHDRILKVSGGSWYTPPARIEVRDRHRERRERILAELRGEVAAVKDPRMLLLLDFWRELDPAWIGVIRNPVAVCGSLQRRASERGKPSLSPTEWEALWRHYNAVLLAEHERAPFPLVDFERPEELDEQVSAALAFHELASREATGRSFYEPELRSDASDDWRARVLSQESIELWERLTERAAGI